MKEERCGISNIFGFGVLQGFQRFIDQMIARQPAPDEQPQVVADEDRDGFVRENLELGWRQRGDLKLAGG